MKKEEAKISIKIIANFEWEEKSKDDTQTLKRYKLDNGLQKIANQMAPKVCQDLIEIYDYLQGEKNNENN